MSAEPVPSTPSPWQPDPVRQARADYTLDDLRRIPPNQVELVDGVLYVTPSPSLNHQSVSRRLANWLERHAPRDLRASQDVEIALGPNTARQPDVLLCRADADGDRWYLHPDEVVLAVEIVSPGSRRMDRFTKLTEYAAAGIPCYWRIEQDPPHVYAYRLSDQLNAVGEPQYELVTEGADVIELTEPFELKLPIAEITP
ncbi:Uma2 family endonuclease [Plantactinospora siamensis]|uniref:Uma2 family endonuclease n=1 Tax=Plantactinospora siamensis TaxID=555372 RepID=A0ABV6NZA8_9ACTN